MELLNYLNAREKYLSLITKDIADVKFEKLHFIPIRIERRRIYRFFRYILKTKGLKFLRSIALKIIRYFFKQYTLRKAHFWHFVNTNKTLFFTLKPIKYRQTKSKRKIQHIFATIINLFTRKTKKW